MSNIFIPHNTKKSKLADIDSTEILGINVAVIAGVLIFLSLTEGFDVTEQTQITIITANIVFPFAISAILETLNHEKYATRFMIGGFINLFLENMKINGSSEHHQNNNLKVVIAYGNFIGKDNSFYDIIKRSSFRISLLKKL